MVRLQEGGNPVKIKGMRGRVRRRGWVGWGRGGWEVWRERKKNGGKEKRRRRGWEVEGGIMERGIERDVSERERKLKGTG